jgi:hypothetical protein
MKRIEVVSGVLTVLSLLAVKFINETPTLFKFSSYKTVEIFTFALMAVSFFTFTGVYVFNRIRLYYVSKRMKRILNKRLESAICILNRMMK